MSFFEVTTKKIDPDSIDSYNSFSNEQSNYMGGALKGFTVAAPFGAIAGGLLSKRVPRSRIEGGFEAYKNFKNLDPVRLERALKFLYGVKLGAKITGIPVALYGASKSLSATEAEAGLIPTTHVGQVARLGSSILGGAVGGAVAAYPFTKYINNTKQAIGYPTLNKISRISAGLALGTVFGSAAEYGARKIIGHKPQEITNA